MDGDDLYHPQKLEKSIEVFRQYPDIDVVFHDIKFIDKKGVEQNSTYLGAVNFAARVLSKSKQIGESLYLCDERALFFFMCTKVTTIYTSAVAIRRNRLAAEQVFFPEDLTLGEDVDLWFRLVKTGRVAYIDRPLSFYRIHPSSVTKRPDRNIYDPVAAHIRNFERVHDILDDYQIRRYRKRIAKDLFDVAYTYSVHGRYKDAMQFYLESLRWSFDIAAVKAIIKTGCYWGLTMIGGRL